MKWMKSWIVQAILWTLIDRQATAQQTWVVDAQGRPGAHFVDIGQAILSTLVHAGDTVEVRGGTYPQFALFKGLKLVATEPATVVAAPVSGVPNITVLNIPSGAVAIIEGFAVQQMTGGSVMVKVRDCPGSVVLRNVTESITAPGNSWLFRTVSIVNAAFVDIESSDLSAGGNGLDVVSSRVLIHDSLIANTPPTIYGTPGWPALTINNSHVEITSSTIVGAPGYRNNPLWPPQPAMPAIVATGSSTLRVGPTAIINSGPPDAQQSGFGAAAIEGRSSVAACISPQASLGAAGAPIVGGVVPSYATAPEVHLRDAHNTQVGLAVRGSASAPMVLMVGRLAPVSIAGALLIVDPLQLAWLPVRIDHLGLGSLHLRLPGIIPGFMVAGIQALDLSAATTESMLSYPLLFSPPD